MSWEVINGDCVQAMRQMEADTFDLCVTSPPYDNLRQYGGYSFDFEATARELYRVIKPGGVVVWVVGDATVNGSETGTSFRQALYFKDVCGFNLHDTMIYETDKPPMNDRRYQACFEYMFVLSKGRPNTFNPLKVKSSLGGKRRLGITYREPDGSLKEQSRGGLVADETLRTSIWFFQAGASKGTLDDYAFSHPATFPERLAYDHILSWSNEGDRVLDPFCGSGTTGKMAVIARRNFVGIEVNPEYVALAEARIKRASGIPADIPRLNRREIETPLFPLNTEAA